ncbi:MAG TPA: DUF899 domain-containing protein [Solirubrobacterales bacterium]|nr:DUF899 domain-containing protein [Solirubrobacterales bacterium]
MTEHATATREEWQAARDELLKREKELTRRNDELARERRELPWVALEKEYSFEAEDGTKTLAELFDGRSQLLAYGFMFGPAYEAGCPVCSSGADTFDGAVPHLNARDVTFTCISRAPLAKLQAYKQRMGWSFPWVSSGGSDFNFDFGASHTEEEIAPFLEGDLGPVPEVAAACGTDPAGFMTEAPVLNAFALENGAVYQTYSTGARGLEPLLGYYGLLDRAPRGRDEGDPPNFWIRRHDQYEDVPAGATG